MMSSAISNNQGGRTHPHKFTMWVAIASICMMFAGLTSAYVVKKSQDNVIRVLLPNVFWWSTAVIILSSVTIHLAVKSIKAREMQRYRLLLGITAFLGVVFAIMQYKGFSIMGLSGVKFIGKNSNPGASFLVVIIGLHALHVLGGVIALLVMYIKIFVSKVKSYNTVPVEVVATYWHFVDVLWLYLLLFLIYMR
ncbi:MAG: cytochrome c oxidase subunit 3 [Bacteroidetes bacterium]|nr:cytochrome c oxidase subunit 3 [Bacteroidota bacterium]